MRKSIFETIIHSNIKNIWKIITDNEHYLWRSDILEIKIIEPHYKFIGASKNGIQTVFTITAMNHTVYTNLIWKINIFEDIGLGVFRNFPKKKQKSCSQKS